MYSCEFLQSVFFLLCFLKDRVYGEQLATADELKNGIITEAELVPSEMVDRAVNHLHIVRLLPRLAGGAHIEHVPTGCNEITRTSIFVQFPLTLVPVWRWKGENLINPCLCYQPTWPGGLAFGW